MAAILIQITDKQLRQRREELLAILSFPEEELINRTTEDHTALPGENEIYRELAEISFLLE